MSQFPYGYTSQGHLPQQPHNPYPPYGAYPPAYPSGEYAAEPQQPSRPPGPYSQPTSNHYAASHSAYDYNAHSIPGLGAPLTGPLAPTPFNPSWNQGGNGSNAHTTQYTAYSTQSMLPSVHLANANPPGLTPDPQLPGLRTQNEPEHSKAQSNEHPIVQPQQQITSTDYLDEGEITEPDFDDLYDDTPNQAPVVEPAAKSFQVHEDTVVDGSDQEPNFYDTDLEEASPLNTKSSTTVPSGKEQEVAQAPEEVDRERSRSYSPYLSPREIQVNTLKSEIFDGKVRAESQVQEQSSNNIATIDPLIINEVSGIPTNASNNIITPIAAPTVLKTSSTSTVQFTSISEARNEAKKAILKLLPHGVKYQEYIDEGFDPILIKELFSQLNLPTDPAPPASNEKPAAPVLIKGKLNQEIDKLSQKMQADNMAKKQEERKDRIARLLAERKAKAADNSSNSEVGGQKAIASSPNGTSIPANKFPTTKAEKDLLLRKKMEELRKAREAKIGEPRGVAGQNSKPDAEKPASAVLPQVQNPVGELPAKPTATTTAYIGSKSATPQSVSSAAPSPALSGTPSGPRAVQQLSQRKRPVAADFMDYPPASVKRPFTVNRQSSSLVISVSDDEDDEDEDVEMEVESAEESPAPVQQSFSIPRRGPSIRDYPPLTNKDYPRQVSSPVSGTSASGNRSANSDLKAREEEIEKLKRKIQEAEARNKAKSTIGSATPQSPGSVTPQEHASKSSMTGVALVSDLDDRSDPSAQLLQEAEAAAIMTPSEFHSARRHSESDPNLRASRTPVARQSAKMQEKAERLRKMQEEMMKLQAEIDEEMISSEDDNVIGADSVKPSTPLGKSETSEVSSHHNNTDPSFSGVSPVAPDAVALATSSQQQSENMESQSGSSDDEMEISASSAESSTHQIPRIQITGQSLLQDSNASGADEQLDEGLSPVTDPASLQGEVAGSRPSTSDDGYEPPEPSNINSATASPPVSSSAPAEISSTNALSGIEPQEVFTPMPDQISMASATSDNIVTEKHSHSLEAAREVHAACSSSLKNNLTFSKANYDAKPKAQTSYVEYQSPLRYFNAYRFHPNYSETIHGGLKSLTYSNRIDPKKEMCPEELDGSDCPRGDACQFQHFHSIIAPDNDIVLELGSSEEFSGDQKKDFNNGLRELVSSFQRSKVRDFPTIAQGIVDFRRRFLGDPSKVLHLEGTNI